MIVFLDFDGVVHPEQIRRTSDLFCRLHLIEAVLREFPAVEIVISSAWRVEYANDELAVCNLRENFSSDIAPRVVGVTPVFMKFMDKDSHEVLSSFTRHWECEAWMGAHRPPGTRWMAMDDRAYLFRPFCDNLMAFDRLEAFKQEHQDPLRQYLVALTQDSPWPAYCDRNLS